MIPTVCLHRYDQPGALWANQLTGEFVEGDSAVTKFFVEGRIEVKQLGGRMKAFFQSVILKPRIPEKKEKLKGSDDETSSSSDDEETQKNKKAKERVPDGEEIVVPKLAVYLTVKKPKKRMVDAHKLGTRIYLINQPEGKFGELGVASNFEASLMDIVDISAFQGLVVLKLPTEEPATEEPVIYGYVRFLSNKSLKIKSLDSINLRDYSDLVSKLMVKEKNGNALLSLGPHSKKLVKSLKVYGKLANKAWYELKKDETIDFSELLSVLNKLDMFMLKTQAKRLFQAVDVGKVGQLGIADLENFFIAKDLVGQLTTDMLVLDVFDALKGLPYVGKNNEILVVGEDGVAPEAPTPPPQATPAEATRPQPPTDQAAAPQPEQPPQRQQAPKKEESPERKEKRLRREEKLMGIDYAAFQEVISVLGYKKPDRRDLRAQEAKSSNGEALQLAAKDLEKDEELEEYIRSAFCFGGGIKEKDADHKLLTIGDLRKAWCKIADLPVELQKRGIKSEGGLFVEGRNRERLQRSIVEAESNYLSVLSRLSDFISTMKQDHRQRRDQRRRDREAEKERLVHEANKFIAQRGQEKRLQLKKEQEERSKKRVEDKVLRNKLLLQQQENLNKQRADIAQANAEKLRLKKSEIQRMGLDRIDLSVKKLRSIPTEVYKGANAQTKLTYAVLLDLSRNLLEALPEDVFFYWLTEVRMCKLSENRIKVLPPDFTDMAVLEILEIEKNRLEELPVGLGAFANLQRLEVANNKLSALPDSIGSCSLLRFLSVHSNQLTTLPASLGQLYKLEYLDASRNAIRELPEDLEHLVSLVHLDLSSNQVTFLFHNMGQLVRLQYLDMHTNLLSTLPASFGALEALEYCNLENNELLTLLGCFHNTHHLKFLNLRKNNIHAVTGDLGGCVNLTLLDLSLNRIEQLPREVGLLADLIDLHLSYNSLACIPPEMGACGSLIRLTLHRNCIRGPLPATLALIRSLQELDISDNEVTSLPESVAGFQELALLRAERCLLSELPQAIVHLPKLTALLLSSNKFARFPMHLQQMPWLRTLDLSNNSLTLLPRAIKHVAFLHKLNLRNNQLQALPVEFVEVFESVPEVDLAHNPWTLLPKKWGLQPLHAVQDRQESNSQGFGYSLQAALDFLYAVAAFYYHAEEAWDTFGVFYYSGRLGLSDFVLELKRRVCHGWHEGLTKYAEHVYFSSKESGAFMRWYEPSAELLEREQQYLQRDRDRKDSNIERSRRDVAVRAEQAHRAYDVDLPRRVRQAEQLIDENHKNLEYIETVQLQALQGAVLDQSRRVEAKMRQQQALNERFRKQELSRMFEILNQDRPVRALEKEHAKYRK